MYNRYEQLPQLSDNKGTDCYVTHSSKLLDATIKAD